jgi:hypothetical protein
VSAVQGEEHPSNLALRERCERAIAQLTESFARDEIGLEAFEARIDAVYCSQSLTECDALVADLGRSDFSGAGVIVVAQAELARNDQMGAVELAPLGLGASIPIVRALFSNIERCDQVVMPHATRVEAVFGNVEIDLRKAIFASGITEIAVKAIFSSIEIVVPADMTVEVHGAGIFGNFEGTSRTIADPDAPTLRIVGSAIFASVVVRTLPPLRVQRLVEQVRAQRLMPPRG